MNDTDDARTAALEGVDLAALHRLREDARIWTLADIQPELDLSRHVLRALWRTACNYIYGGHREWPPRGQVLRVRMPDVGEPVTDLRWPPDPQLFPPPDVSADRGQPRWRAGTIRVWAVQVGRLTPVGLAPARVSPRGVRQRPTPPLPDVSGISLAALHEMVANEELWTTHDIADFLGITWEPVKRWFYATRNRFERGVTTWPPSSAESLREWVAPTGEGLDWWPNHYRLLPPPHSTDTDGYRWRAGDVIKWALEVGRLLPDGTATRMPVTLTRSKTPREER